MPAMGKRLNHKLDCKDCGTIYLDIPDDADDDTPIRCSTCGAALGTWGSLQDDFLVQTQGTSGAFDLSEGQFEEKHLKAVKQPQGEAPGPETGKPSGKPDRP